MFNEAEFNDAYFKYIRTYRRSALKVLLNIIILCGMYAALKYWYEVSLNEALAEIVTIADIAVIVVLLILLSLFCYFWINKQQTQVVVTPNYLFFHDPFLRSCTLKIKVEDISELRLTTDVRQQSHSSRLYMSNGESHELMLVNMYIDQKAFFAALKKANDKILLPQNPYRYKVVRPLWAKKFRQKFMG